jgi:hypothetical protein
MPFTVEGKVEKFASIHPARILLRGPAGLPIKGVVRIIPEKKYPFTLKEITDARGKNITYSLEEIHNETSAEYLLTVINTRDTQGTYHEVIALPTDLDMRPEIKIWVYGELAAPLSGKKETPQ